MTEVNYRKKFLDDERRRQEIEDEENKPKPETKYRNFLLFSSFLALIALGLLVFSFATDFWVIYTVANTTRTEDGFTPHAELYYSRKMGLFRTCFYGDTAWMNVDKFSKYIIDSNCFQEQGYELSDFEPPKLYGIDYELRTHLMRTMFSFFALGLVFLAIGLTLGLFSAWFVKYKMARYTAVILLVAGLFAMGATALFMGIRYMDEEKLTEADLPILPPYAFYSTKTAYAMLVASAKNGDYGVSFYLSWGAAGVAILAGVLFIKLSMDIKNEQRMSELQQQLLTGGSSTGMLTYGNNYGSPYGGGMNYGVGGSMPSLYGSAYNFGY